MTDDIENVLPEHVADLALLPDPDDAICYAPADGGGYQLSPEARQIQADLLAERQRLAERGAQLMQRLGEMAIRREIAEALTEAGCRRELIEGAVAHLVSAHRWKATGDPENLLVTAEAAHGPVTAGHFVQSWLAIEGQAFRAPVKAAGPLATQIRHLRVVT